jgi:hypothetical protein
LTKCLNACLLAACFLQYSLSPNPSLLPSFCLLLAAMSTDLPSRPLPAHLASRALPALLAKLRPLSPSHLSFSHSLRGALHALALTRLHEPLRAAPPHSDVPLKLLLEVSQSGPPEILDLATVVDAALAYPTHPAQLSTLWGRAISHDPTLTDTVRTEILPSLIERLRLSPSAGTIRMVTYSLLTLSRAHEELLALLLSEADFIVPALKDAYAALPQVPRKCGQRRGRYSCARRSRTPWERSPKRGCSDSWVRALRTTWRGSDRVRRIRTLSLLSKDRVMKLLARTQ